MVYRCKVNNFAPINILFFSKKEGIRLTLKPF